MNGEHKQTHQLHCNRNCSTSRSKRKHQFFVTVRPGVID
jgi:hypothetical protein